MLATEVPIQQPQSPASPAKLNGPTPDQRKAIDAIKTWYAAPIETGRVETQFAVLTGFAGTGKTHTCETLVAELMAEHDLREDQILDPSEILGCSPTHNAVGTLRQRLPGEATAKTIHSALGLAMKKAKLTDEQAEKLDILRGRAATDPTFSNEDQAILDRLEAIETKQLKHAKILQPMKEPEDLAMALKDFRLIILDEAFMTNREIYGLLLETFMVSIPAEVGYSPNKILCVGDPAQLAPVGEIESKVTELPVVAHLDKVVRYSGPTLDYVTRIRQGGDLHFSHQDLIQSLDMVEEPVFISLPESEVIAGLAEQIYHMGSENVRILSPTNRRVRELNELAQMAVSDTPDRFRVGDNLITRQPVMYESPNQYVDVNGYIRGPEKEIIFTTSSLLSIREIIGERKQTAITGTEYTIQTVKAAYHGEKMTHVIDVVAPLQIAQWETELERFGKLADTTSTRSKKPGARGQKGDAAKELWAMIGLKNWEKTLPERHPRWAEWDRYPCRPNRKSRARAIALSEDSEIDKDQYEMLKRHLWREKLNFGAMAAPVQMAYASSVHRAQGRTIPLTILDFFNFLPKRGEGDGVGTTWNLRALLYTAASRATAEGGGQLVLMT